MIFLTTAPSWVGCSLQLAYQTMFVRYSNSLLILAAKVLTSYNKHWKHGQTFFDSVYSLPLSYHIADCSPWLTNLLIMTIARKINLHCVTSSQGKADTCMWKLFGRSMPYIMPFARETHTALLSLTWLLGRQRNSASDWKHSTWDLRANCKAADQNFVVNLILTVPVQSEEIERPHMHAVLHSDWENNYVWLVISHRSFMDSWI